jgi:hypothetical protein
MASFRRLRLPPSFSPVLLVLALASPALRAQTPNPSPADALTAADPASPSTPLALPLPAPLQTQAPAQPDDIERARALWRQANARVAEFPRGHVDLLRWEAAQSPSAPAASPTNGPTLGLDEALRLALPLRPEVFTRPGMNEREQALVRRALAEQVRTLQQAWIDAVALRQSARLRLAALEAAQTGSELSRRMVQAGNASQTTLLREQLVEAEAWTAATQAQAAARAAAGRLAGLLGLWQADAVEALARRLPVSLPALPDTLQPGPGLTVADIEGAALRSHPDLPTLRRETELALAGLPPQRWQAWREAQQAALQAMPTPGSGPLTPPHLADLSLLGDPALARATQQHTKLLALATERRAMARDAWAQLQLRHAGARHSEDVVAALQTALEQETQLRYNGMLQSTWQLLASARDRLAALDAAALARRDYWRAQADWQALLAGADYDGSNASTSDTGGRSAARGGH